MEVRNNLDTLLDKEIDFLDNNELTLVLDNNTVIIGDDSYSDVNFIKMKILHNSIITSLYKLRELLSRNANTEVMIKQINMEKLSMGIIIRLNKIVICDEDSLIDNIKSQEPVKTELNHTVIYEDNGKIGYNVTLYSTYLECTGLTEYNIKFVDANKNTIILNYGDVNNKYTIINLNSHENITYYTHNHVDSIRDICSLEFDQELGQYPYYVNRLLRLINAKVLLEMFPEELKNL